jgi:hypothetical protein
MSKQRLTDRFGAEVVNFGGQPCRRVDVARRLRADGFDDRTVDRFAFGTRAVQAVPVDYAEIYPS